MSVEGSQAVFSMPRAPGFLFSQRFGEEESQIEAPISSSLLSLCYRNRGGRKRPAALEDAVYSAPVRAQRSHLQRLSARTLFWVSFIQHRPPGLKDFSFKQLRYPLLGQLRFQPMPRASNSTEVEVVSKSCLSKITEAEGRKLLF